MAEITIKAKDVELQGMLEIPKGAKGIVIFVHGSGSSRKSPRNQFVAKFLQSQNIATLLFDLLTPEEEKIDLLTREYRFDIDLLTNRLIDTTKWLLEDKKFKSLKIAYFGASTGAAAAIRAAAKLPNNISYVVSRGGRPDLAKEALKELQAKTLLIVGGDDPIVIECNKEAMSQMKCEKEIEIIPGATHLFEQIARAISLL